jgi:hypothetical protein
VRAEQIDRPAIRPTVLLRFVLVLGLSVGASLLASPPRADASTGAQRSDPSGPTPDFVAEIEAAAEFLRTLVHEINVRRARAGHRPVGLAPTPANAAVTRYLADLTPRMLAAGACFHGNGDPIAPGWDYVALTGFGMPSSGEVITCPAGNGYWTASRIAESWWASGPHRAILYDPSVSLVACGVFGPQRGMAAFTTTACVTFRG